MLCFTRVLYGIFLHSEFWCLVHYYLTLLFLLVDNIQFGKQKVSKYLLKLCFSSFYGLSERQCHIRQASKVIRIIS
jgi:hypothetical protein